MPTPKPNPAEYVIALFGGVRATARALNLTNPAVGYWRKKGYIPMAQLSHILSVCRDRDIKVDRNMLLPR